MKILGFNHEFARPDRDEYVIMYSDNWQWQLSDNALKMSLDDWENTGHPFELESVMNYCSKCGGKHDLTVMTTLKGETWTSSFIEKVTTTDYLQIHWAYCKNNSIFSDGKIFEEKDTVKCTSNDTVVQNFNRPIFTDRICDGKVKFMKST